MKGIVATVYVVLAVTAATATGASGCAARQANATTGDEVLKARVEAALASASDVNAGGIIVDASRGVVTVSGTVASGTEQQSVGAIVRAVPGVTQVRFSLSVEDPGDRP